MWVVGSHPQEFHVSGYDRDWLKDNCIGPYICGVNGGNCNGWRGVRNVEHKQERDVGRKTMNNEQTTFDHVMASARLQVRLVQPQPPPAFLAFSLLALLASPPPPSSPFVAATDATWIAHLCGPIPQLHAPQYMSVHIMHDVHPFASQDALWDHISPESHLSTLNHSGLLSYTPLFSFCPRPPPRM